LSEHFSTNPELQKTEAATLLHHYIYEIADILETLQKRNVSYADYPREQLLLLSGKAMNESTKLGDIDLDPNIIQRLDTLLGDIATDGGITREDTKKIRHIADMIKFAVTNNT